MMSQNSAHGNLEEVTEGKECGKNRADMKRQR